MQLRNVEEISECVLYFLFAFRPRVSDGSSVLKGLKCLRKMFCTLGVFGYGYFYVVLKMAEKFVERNLRSPT